MNMDLEEFKIHCETLGYPELGNLYKELKQQKEDIEEAKSSLQKKFDHLRLSVIPNKMFEDGVNSITLEGIGRIGLTSDAYVSVSKENKAEFYSWMEENGHGGLIAPYVQPNTLKAFVKEIYENHLKGEENCELPEDLVKIEPFMRASVTKR